MTFVSPDGSQELVKNLGTLIADIAVNYQQLGDEYTGVDNNNNNNGTMTSTKTTKKRVTCNMFVVGIGPTASGSFELCQSRLFGHWHWGSQCSHGDDQGTAGSHHRTRPRSTFPIDINRVLVVVVVMMKMIMSGEHRKIRSFFGFELLIGKNKL
jgi:hypothetical protein